MHASREEDQNEHGGAVGIKTEGELLSYLVTFLRESPRADLNDVAELVVDEFPEPLDIHIEEDRERTRGQKDCKGKGKASNLTRWSVAIDIVEHAKMIVNHKG